MKRRELLAGSVAAALVSGSAASATGAPPPAGAATPRHVPALDLSTEASRLRAFIRMSGSTDGALLWNYLKTTYFGTVDGRMVPFHGLAAVVISRHVPLPGGGWLATSLEQAYRTDLETGKVLERWRNPVTGETVPVPPWNFTPVRTRIAPNLEHTRTDEVPGRIDTHRILSVDQQGDDVVFATQSMIDVTRQLSPAPFVYNELLTLKASARDLMAPDLPHVPAVCLYTSLATRWRPWMRMGDRPGQFVGSGLGRYGVAIADLPAVWLAETERVRPQLLKDPAAALSASPG